LNPPLYPDDKVYAQNIFIEAANISSSTVQHHTDKMKLNTAAMRYLTPDDFRVLTAAEMGSKNHEVVPTKLITQIAKLKSVSATNRSISDLAKAGLIARVKNAKYDGYRLTYGGYDYLALKAFIKRDTVFSVGAQIGIGKESDIVAVSDAKGTSRVLKIHRLGRISFRTVKNNRDYLKNRSSASWMYLSRLAAQKEFAFMKALHDEGFEVPTPIDQSRHQIVMSLIDGFPMRQLQEHDDPARLYQTLMDFIVPGAQ
jgi:RIO kinase 2